MIKDLIRQNRSYRRFDNEHTITRKELEQLIELARISASASNRQALRFYITYSDPDNDKVFSCLKWAGYLSEWQGPAPVERPTAYIVILKPADLSAYIGHDTGIACQSILLGAVEMGLGGCMFGSVDKPQLQTLLNLPAEYSIELVIALGKPTEIVQIDTVKNNDIKYWRDSDRTHHVPKRKLQELIINSE
ncbi:MAG: nitroreductase family protein [Candidatus Cloacimonetes bacterium]|nr:nitroreductase family protein [Candidatus Cloacimonadota bacterium]